MKNETMTISSPLFVITSAEDFNFDGKRELAENQEYSTTKFRKDGTPKIITHNKKKGKKSEVYDLSLDDMRNILAELSRKEKWLHYMLATVAFNLARRKGDILSLTWAHFFDTNTGAFKDRLEDIKEQKTSKLSAPYINEAVKSAITLYLDKVNYNPADDGYTRNIAYQFTGNYKGNRLSDSSFYKVVKKAAQDCGIEFNVALHSLRKGFGAVSYEMHKREGNSAETLRSIFNHSSLSTTDRYIGNEEKRIKRYYQDIGEAFNRAVVNGEEISFGNGLENVSDGVLKILITKAYQAGLQNAGESDLMKHMDNINAVLAEVRNNG